MVARLERPSICWRHLLPLFERFITGPNAATPLAAVYRFDHRVTMPLTWNLPIDAALGNRTVQVKLGHQ